MVYKPTYNWGAPSCSFQWFWVDLYSIDVGDQRGASGHGVLLTSRKDAAEGGTDSLMFFWDPVTHIHSTDARPNSTVFGEINPSPILGFGFFLGFFSWVPHMGQVIK